MREFIKAVRWSALAGMLDGDGSISLTDHEGSRQKHFFLNVGVASTERSTVKWLVLQFGGQFRRQEEKRDNMKDSYQWLAKGRQQQQRVLQGLLPFLVMKGDVARKALEYFDAIPFGVENPSLRSRYAEEMSALNEFFVPVCKRPVVPLLAVPSSLGRVPLAFMAGVLDAEGTFSLPTIRAGSPQIQVSNTDMRILDWAYDRFGGIVSASKKENEKHRMAGIWRLSGGRCQQREYLASVKKAKELFLLAVLPYLTTKKRHAIVSLACIRGDKPKDVCFRELKELNKVGTPTTNTSDCPENGQKIESELVGDYESDAVVTLSS